MKAGQSCLTLGDSMGCPWNSLGQNTGVGGLSLLQGIFPTQGSNPGISHIAGDSLPAEPPGKPSTYFMGWYKIGLVVKWLEQCPLELFLCFYHLPLYYFPVVDKSQKKLSLISYSLLLQVCSSDWNPEGKNNPPYVILLFFFVLNKQGPEQGSNSFPLKWRCRILTTKLTGNSLLS